MALSEARKRANKKWNDENMKDKYDRIQIVVAKGQKEVIQTAATACGESVSEYIKTAIAERMERGGSGFGFADEMTLSDNRSRLISQLGLFSESELNSIIEALPEDLTVEDFIRLAVLDKLKSE